MINAYLIIGFFVGLLYILHYAKNVGLDEDLRYSGFVVAIVLAIIYLLGFIFWPIAVFEMIKYIYTRRRLKQ